MARLGSIMTAIVKPMLAVAVAVLLSLGVWLGFRTDEPTVRDCRPELTNADGSRLSYDQKRELRNTYRVLGLDPEWVDGDFFLTSYRGQLSIEWIGEEPVVAWWVTRTDPAARIIGLRPGPRLYLPFRSGLYNLSAVQVGDGGLVCNIQDWPLW